MVQDTWELIVSPFYDRGGNDVGIAWQLLASLKRVAYGYSLAVLVGVSLGVLVGQSTWALRGLDPLFQVLRTVPPLAWLPISLAGFRDGHPSAIFVIFITSIWPIIINTSIGIRNIPEDYRNVAKVVRLNGMEYFAKIMLPAAAPFIFSGLRIGVGLSWLAIIAAEMLIGGVGIGFFIWDAWNSSRISDIILALFYVGLIGFALDRIVAFVANKVTRGTAAQLTPQEHPWATLTTSSISQVDMTFASASGVNPVLAGIDLNVAPRRVRLPHRPFGLRQVDGAQHRRRPAQGHLGRCDPRRPRGERARPGPRGGVPEPLAAAVAHRATRTSPSRWTRSSADTRNAAERSDWMLHNLRDGQHGRTPWSGCRPRSPAA